MEFLFASLEDCKSEMDYENVDFISDVVGLLSRIRKRIAIIFVAEDFGPVELPNK